MTPRTSVKCVALAVAALLPLSARAAAAITVDTAGTTTRVLLTFDPPASCTATQGPARLEVVCNGPVAFTPPEGTIADGILSGWQADGDRKLVLGLGAGYRRYESFELSNPKRLVLDLSGVRTRVPATAAAPYAPRPTQRVVVLDPGHGGIETGAIGTDGLQEKDVTLDLARRLKDALERQGLTVVLTRDEDRLVGLDERTAVANHNRAELFVSIHLNASRGKKAFGAETYFLSPDATDDEARTLAALENRAYREADAPPAATGAESPDASLELILWDLAQNRFLAESSRLAETVQKEMNDLVGTRDRGVRQAPFRVLMGATMPAILVEVGFVSNPEEEARLRDDAYKGKVVEALARAIGAFRGGAR